MGPFRSRPLYKKQKALVISKRLNRIKDATARNHQVILFSAFALEYRFRRLYEILGIKAQKKDGLHALIQNFSNRVSTATHIDGKGPVRLSSEWTSIQKKLLQMNEWRNKIAHANYAKVLTLLSSDMRNSRREARACFNVLRDAIRVTNRAIGFDLDSARAGREYYARLRIQL